MAVGAKQVAFLGLFPDVGPGSTGKDVATEPAFLEFRVPVMHIKHLRVISPFTSFALATQKGHQFAFDIGSALVLVFVPASGFPTSSVQSCTLL